MLRIVVSGICGRTGSVVAAAVCESDGFELIGGLERPDHPSVGATLKEIVGETAGDGRVLSDFAQLDVGKLDVIVDFSTPDQAARCADFAGKTGKGLVTGTTGLEARHLATVNEASSRCAVVLAPNTGVGANLLFAAVAEMAAVTGPGFDVEIVETHHSGKRDAPSGTALRLAEAVAAARGLSASEAVKAGRKGPDTLRGAGEIGIHSVRGGGVTGIHSVHFMSPSETLTIEHVAHSRRAFADGALAAALFVGRAAPGLYDMADVLGLSRVKPHKGDDR